MECNSVVLFFPDPFRGLVILTHTKSDAQFRLRFRTSRCSQSHLSGAYQNSPPLWTSLSYWWLVDLVGNEGMIFVPFFFPLLSTGKLSMIRGNVYGTAQVTRWDL